MSLESRFVEIALKPLESGAEAVKKQDVPSFLNAIEDAQILSALQQAVAAVASKAGVAPESVWQALPFEELEKHRFEVARCQQKVVEIWNQHQGGVAGFLSGLAGGFVEGYLGLDGTGVGEFVAELAGGTARDARLKGPVNELAAAGDAYEAAIRQAASTLDSALRKSGTAASQNVGAPAYCLIACLVSLLLTVAHWGARALFFPDEKSVEVSTLETVQVNKQVMTKVASPRFAKVQVLGYPTAGSKPIGVAERKQEYLVLPADTNAPDGWVRLDLGDGASGWVPTGKIRINEKLREVAATESQEKVRTEVRKAFHFGKPDFTDLLRKFGTPLWIYIVAALVIVILALAYSTETTGGKVLLFLLLCSGLVHVTVQGTSFLAFYFWATPV